MCITFNVCLFSPLNTFHSVHKSKHKKICLDESWIWIVLCDFYKYISIHRDFQNSNFDTYCKGNNMIAMWGMEKEVALFPYIFLYYMLSILLMGHMIFPLFFVDICLKNVALHGRQPLFKFKLSSWYSIFRMVFYWFCIRRCIAKNYHRW